MAKACSVHTIQNKFHSVKLMAFLHMNLAVASLSLAA